MKIYSQMGTRYFVAAGALGSLLLTQGCIATRDWVKEQMDPLSNRVSTNEQKFESQIATLSNRTTAVEGKLGQFEGRLGQFDGRLGQVDTKTDKALNTLANLRLERRFVIDMKEGANFAFNSANLPAQVQKEIDGFLSDLKGDAAGADTIFLVAGHTDNVGSENVNYELGKKRADAVSRYLITQKKIDPLKVVSVSYGESAPLQDNSSSQGRAKNRRVEILVYRDGITSAPSTAGAPSSQAEPPRASQQGGERLSQSQR
jgi:outer membrane protein OmpA-like peptidoglycan-associated protein